MAKKKRGKGVISRVNKHVRKAHKHAKNVLKHVSNAKKRVLGRFNGRNPSRKSKVSKVRKLIRLALQRRRK